MMLSPRWTLLMTQTTRAVTATVLLRGGRARPYFAGVVPSGAADAAKNTSHRPPVSCCWQNNRNYFLRGLSLSSSSSSDRDDDDDDDDMDPQQLRQTLNPQDVASVLNRTSFKHKKNKNGGSNDNNSKRRKRNNRSGAVTHHRFVDRLRLRAHGGGGGRGCLSAEALMGKGGRKLRPDGGHGGSGGSVVLVADPAEQALGASWASSTAATSQHWAAAHPGAPGRSKERLGKRGKNLVLRVPCGVVVKRILNHDEVWDEETNQVLQQPQHEEANFNAWKEQENEQEDDNSSRPHLADYNFDDSWEDYYDKNNDDDKYKATPQDIHRLQQGLEIDVFPENETPKPIMEDDDSSNPFSQSSTPRKRVVLADLDTPGSHVLVARGGLGGIGTMTYARRHGPMPTAQELTQKAQPDEGETAYLELELKLVADIGLVGFPNAGKSSLLRAMSRATPAVAPYPFTTLHPYVGVLEYRDGARLRAADIPGLIDGAAQGRGCGHDFLRHVERTQALLYLVDAAGVDYRNPHDDLRVLVHELASYGDGTLLDRRALVVANKVDLIDADVVPDLLASLSDLADELQIRRSHRVMGISAGVTGEGLSDLSQAMRTVVAQSEADGQQSLEDSQQERAFVSQ